MVIFQHTYYSNLNITTYDLLIIPILLLILLYAEIRKNKKTSKESFYKFYPSAIATKVIVCLVFALIVLFIYPGDSMAYFININCLNNLFYIDSSKYLDIILHGNRPEYLSYFNYNTGYPENYMWRDPAALFVARIYAPLMLFTYKSYLLSTITAGLIGFTGIWKLYSVFCKLYPSLEKQFALAIIYFPSTLFWSSGLMKDTLTLSAIGWIVYSLYMLIIERKFKIHFILFIIIASTIIINIKAYIFIALIPGLLIWIFFDQISKIKSDLLKFVAAPILIVLTTGGLILILTSLSDRLGVYGNVDSSIKQAQIIQQDLTRAEQYGDNYYDIGKFEATPMGALSKAPISIISGIFRPFIWEANNPFVLLAALESLFLICFLLFVIFKTGLIQFIKIIFNDPLLIFAFSFVILFGFGVGLASANFGALVRYKIPLLPFFMAALFIINEKSKLKKKKF